MSLHALAPVDTFHSNKGSLYQVANSIVRTENIVPSDSNISGRAGNGIDCNFERVQTILETYFRSKTACGKNLWSYLMSPMKLWVHISQDSFIAAAK